MKSKKLILITTIILLITLITIIIIKNPSKTTISGLQAITYEEIKEKQQNKDDFILIVSRTTCSHCATYKPKVNQLAKEHDIVVYYIDFDTLSNSDKFLEDLHLTGATPITLFFKKGKETSILNRLEGDFGSKVIEEKFEEMGFINQ